MCIDLNKRRVDLLFKIEFKKEEKKLKLSNLKIKHHGKKSADQM